MGLRAVDVQVDEMKRGEIRGGLTRLGETQRDNLDTLLRLVKIRYCVSLALTTEARPHFLRPRAPGLGREEEVIVRVGEELEGTAQTAPSRVGRRSSPCPAPAPDWSSPTHAALRSGWCCEESERGSAPASRKRIVAGSAARRRSW